MRTLLGLLVTALPLCAPASTLRIENESLAVQYEDTTGAFALSAKAGGSPFARDGRLEGAASSATAEDVADPVFGAGRGIRVRMGDGSTASMELYPDLPFLLIRGARHNGGTNGITVARCVPATFTLDLAKPAAELRTMGTGGLLPPDENPGSYVFLTCADPATRRGVVAGWITHDRGSGVLFSEMRKGLVRFKAQIDYGRLLIEPGRSAALETLAVGVFDDARIGQERFADAIRKHYDIRLRPRSPGFCTWYSEVGGLTDKKGGAGALNEKDIVTLTEFAAQELQPYGFGFVQIDDEWQDGASNPDGSRINGPRRGFTRHKPDGPYPSGMAKTAEMIKRNGLTAGIWILPFARNHQDPEYKDRQDWFVKRLDGKPYETVWGGTSLDLTHPEVQAHLVELAQTLKGWGYDYFKMDGLWTGSAIEQIYVNDGYKDDQIGNNAPFRDPRVTNIEAMRSGLKMLRKAAGPRVYFSGCCASQNMRSLGGAVGLVDSMRVGPDNGFEWQDYRKEVMHFEGGGIITGPIRANRLYFLHGRVWWNDPDPAYVRPAVKLSHAQLLASWIALAGAFNLNSDWLPGLPPERLDILKRCMPSHSAQARPVDYFDTGMPSIWLLTQSEPPVRRDVLGLYNWESEARAIGYDAAKAGLDGTATYHAFDFWGNAPLADFNGAFKIDVPAESCRIVAVRKAEGRPVLVSTSRHVTQGVVDISGEDWQGNQLSATSQLVAGDPYEARIAGMEKWKAVAATAPAGVAIALLPSEPGWLRVRMDSKTSRSVTWSVTCEAR
jgi:hypothetical protein